MRFATRSRTGFTLIEIFVVLVIISVITTMAIANFQPGDSHILDREAKRLALLLGLAGEEAVATGETIGFSIRGDGYTFLRLTEENEWVPLKEDELFKTGSMADNVKLVYAEVNSRKVLSDHIYIFSGSGSHAPFDITLGLNDLKTVVRSDPLGRVGVADRSGQ